MFPQCDYDPSIRQLITLVERDCKAYGVQLVVSSDKKVDQGEGCLSTGFFDEKKLGIALNQPYWWMTLCHEYCHLQQWVEQSPLWLTSQPYDSWFFSWLAKGPLKETNPYKLAKARRGADALREVELDCERRTVKLAKKLGLKFNESDYIRGANAYVLFYTLLKTTRTWYDKPPYQDEIVKAYLPNRFMPAAWYQKLPKQYARTIFEYCLTADQRSALLDHLLNP